MQSLAVFATGRRASTEIANQLKGLFSNTITITAYCLDDLLQSSQVPIKADLAVISCQSVLNQLLAYIHPLTPTMVVRRTLRLEVIDRLMELPAGAKVLLITKSPIGTQEFMQTIEEMGISHISVCSFLTHAYQVCSTIETVLIADEPEQIPPWATKTIDLGVREIELSGLIQIANTLNIKLDIQTPLGTNYLQEIVTRSERLVLKVEAVEHLTYELKSVINNVQESLIVIDANYLIRFVNTIAAKLMGIDSSQAVGSHIYEILPGLQNVMSSNHSLAEDGNLISLEGKTFKVSLQTILDKAGQFIGSVISLRNVTEVLQMEKEVRSALKKRGHVAKYTFADIIGESTALKETIRDAQRLAASNLNVLIWGENGTGKELFAQSIHTTSLFKGGPFIAANCAAFSPSLLESELFGYEDGAFTGAKKGGKQGLIEQANGGTLFLDEIGDIPLEAQSRLLRVIQEREVMRVGGSQIIALDVRIIAATNRNLPELISKGQFRQDLYYRLFVASLHIPPLRERQQDIPLLLRYYMKENGVDERFLVDELLDRLLQYPWPGNIRELQSLIQYAAVVADTPVAYKKAILSRIEDSFQEVPGRIPVKLQLDDSPLFTAILGVLKEAKHWNINLGRGILRKQLQAHNIVISEQSLRNRLNKLKVLGFIASGVGRQGTHITPLGESFLATIDKSSLARTNNA